MSVCLFVCLVDCLCVGLSVDVDGIGQGGVIRRDETRPGWVVCLSVVCLSVVCLVDCLSVCLSVRLDLTGLTGLLLTFTLSPLSVTLWYLLLAL